MSSRAGKGNDIPGVNRQAVHAINHHVPTSIADLVCEFPHDLGRSEPGVWQERGPEIRLAFRVASVVPGFGRDMCPKHSSAFRSSALSTSSNSRMVRSCCCFGRLNTIWAMCITTDAECYLMSQKPTGGTKRQPPKETSTLNESWVSEGGA